MYRDIKLLTIQTPLIFDNEPFSKREAWKWLIENSSNGQLSYSIRYMAGIWKWHRSKV
jgi:hypothetical protein